MWVWQFQWPLEVLQPKIGFYVSKKMFSRAENSLETSF